MCLILIAHRACAEYPLVIAANRDEAYARDALPADWWQECPQVYGGRDAVAGGGWLALSTSGRYAAITNYRQGGARDTALRTRGELVRDYLCGEHELHGYVDAVHRRGSSYNGFSFLAGDRERLYFVSNRGNGISVVTPGVHGLSNHLLDEPWPKVVSGTRCLRDWLSFPEDVLAAHLYEYLADRTMAPDHLLPSTGVDMQRERELSAAFIADERYGTRASTVIIVHACGDVYFGERGFGPQGRPLYVRAQRLRLQARAHARDADAGGS